MCWLSRKMEIIICVNVKIVNVIHVDVNNG